MTESFDFVENNRSPVLNRQFLESFVQFFLKFPHHERATGVLFGGQNFSQFAANTFFFQVLKTEVLAVTGFFDKADGGVDRNAVQPSEKKSIFVESDEYSGTL